MHDPLEFEPPIDEPEPEDWDPEFLYMKGLERDEEDYHT
jgi:hypothetical protein